LTGEYRLIVDDATAHNSKKSAKIIQTKPSANSHNVKAYYRDITIEKDKVYTIAFWAKLDQKEGTEKEIDITIQTVSIIPQLVYFETTILDSTDWKEYIYTFKLPKDVQGDSWIGFLVGLSDVNFWFDDMRFFEGVPTDEIKENATNVSPLSRIISTWGNIKKLK